MLVCVVLRRFRCVRPSSSLTRSTVWLRSDPAGRTRSTGENTINKQQQMCIRHIYMQVFFKYVFITSVLQLHRVDAPGSDGRVGHPRRGRGDRSDEPAGLHRPSAATARTLRQGVPLRSAGQRGDIFCQTSQYMLNVVLGAHDSVIDLYLSFC